jgi:LPS sulfotransferase NodH
MVIGGPWEWRILAGSPFLAASKIKELMITIVSGLPRSGTSLMMQMLAAGGMPVLSDGQRAADSDNPRGYLEWERIKQLPQDPGCIAEAEGKVVKVISRLLLSLPSGHKYRVIFLQRPLPEVLASQDQMLRRRGTYKEGTDAGAIAAAFEKHLREVYAWLESGRDVKSLRVAYHEILSDPRRIAQQVTDFLGINLNLEAMAAQVDESLYRNRKG